MTDVIAALTRNPASASDGRSRIQSRPMTTVMLYSTFAIDSQT